MKLYYLLLLLPFFSCKQASINNCPELSRVEVFSVGFSIQSPISQTETDLRNNPKKVIENKEQLNRIQDLFKSLIQTERENSLASLKVVGDFYCSDGEKYTLLYDKFTIKIGSIYYENNDEFIQALLSEI